MNQFALTPYFHPTTVCFVDDNESFLSTIELEAPRAWTPKLFTNPHQALAYLQTPPELPPLMDRCFSIQRDSREAIIRLDFDLIEQEINHIGRFHRNSVVVVDYSMPSLNGLQLCERLTDPYLRRAMLTGVADEKQAVEAFNIGLLHQFLPKHAGQSVAEIFDFVDRMQQQYFEQYSARLKDTLAMDPPCFLTDAGLARYIRRFLARNRLIEYYLAADPPGLLMLKSSGEIWRLVILEAQELAAQADYAAKYNAPADLVRLLRSGQRIACLTGDTPEDDYSPGEFDWDDKVLPGKKVTGDRGDYYVGVWRDMPGDIDYDPTRSSFDAYLSTL